MSSDSKAATTASVPTTDDRYKIGTLHYTKAGLFAVFSWMIMGNICFNLFEGNGGAGSIPFYLQDNFHISNTMVSVLFNFIPMIIGTFMTPVISFWSDRTRTRLGRRIPYIMFTAPFLVLFAIGLGFSDDIIALCKIQFATSTSIAPLSAALIIIGFLTIGWAFFNEFVGTVYYYLLPDVMPRHFLGRFQGASQIAGTCLTLAMNTWVNPHQLTHIKAIHVGVAILYFVGFGLICWRVKEGQYPPVEDVTEKTTFREKVRLYFKECFNHPMYITIYMVAAVMVLIRGLNPAQIFTLHISQHCGKVTAHAIVKDAIAATPDGAWLVSGGRDGLIKIFQGPGKAFREQCTIARDGEAGSCFAINSDGDLAAIGFASGVIGIWDLARGQCIQTLRGHTGAVSCLAFPNGGTQLASAGADRTIRIWDVRAAKCSSVISNAPNVRALAMTPSGKWLAATDGKRTVQCWDLSKPAVAKSFDCRSDCALGVAITQDGKTVATCSSSGTLEVWDVLETPTVKRQLAAGDTVQAFSLSADGQDLMGYLGACLQTWDTATGKQIGSATLPTNTPPLLALAPNGKRLIRGTPTGALQIWQEPGKTFRLTRILGRRGEPIANLAITQSGDGVAIGSANGTIEIWNAERDRLLQTIDTHAGPVACLAFPRNGGWLASAGSEQTIRIWDSATGSAVKSLPLSENATALAMTRDGSWLASGDGRNSIQCWDLAHDTVVKRFAGSGAGMESLALAADGKTLASHAKGGPVELWAVVNEGRILPSSWWSALWRAVIFDASGADRLNRFKFSAAAQSLCLDADGGELSACSNDLLKRWNVAAGRSVNELSLQTASTSVAMTPDAKRLISGGNDGLLTLWDISNVKKPALLRTMKSQSGVPLAVDISAGGTVAASGTLGGMIDLWDTASGQCMLIMTGHTAFVRSVAFSPDGRRLVSASADNTVRIWDTRTGACLRQMIGHQGEVNCAAFSSTGDRVVSGGDDRKIIVWDAASGAVVKVLVGSPGPVYAVCFAPASGPVPTTERPKQNWVAAIFRNTANYLKNVFINESLFSQPPDKTSKILGQDRWVVSGGRDGETDEVNSGLRLWDIDQGALLPDIESLKTKSLKGHKKAIVSVAYKPDIRVILSASADESIRVWKPLSIHSEITRKADDQSFRTFSGYTHGATGLAIQNKGKTIVNASNDGTLHIWDIDQGISLEKNNQYAMNFIYLFSLLLAYPVGMLVDRWNPLKIVMWSTLLGLPVNIAFYIFNHDYTSNLILSLANIQINMLITIATVPMFVMLYPKTKYGQFSSANAMVRQCVGAFTGILGALLMDHLTASSYDTDNYRYGYLFRGGIYGVSALFLFIVYLYWKKLGGENYVAPEADGKHLERAAKETAAANAARGASQN